MKEVIELRKKTEANIKECKRCIKKRAAISDFEGAIKLQGMIDAYKKVSWDLLVIIRNSKSVGTELSNEAGT